MLKQIPLEKIPPKLDLTSQAILSRPIWEIAKKLGFELEKGEDDFDSYVGFGVFQEDWRLFFAVMRYRGYPEQTSTIYLPYQAQDTKEISKIVHFLVKEMSLSDKDIEWERQHDPAL